MIKSYIIISNIILFIAYIIMFAPIHYIESDFQEKYNSYMFIVNSNCDSNQYRHPYKFVLKYGDLTKDGAAGQTTYTTGLFFDVSSIRIDRTEWNLYNNAERTDLIFHELTHSLFNYRDLYEDQYQHHFMFWRVVSLNSEFQTYQQLNELLQILCKK